MLTFNDAVVDGVDSPSFSPIQHLNGASRKRQRDAPTGAQREWQPFCILPQEDAESRSPFLVRPLRLTTRTSLPLYFLDSQPVSNATTEPAGTFKAYALALDPLRNSPKGNVHSPVLIASADNCSSLYALEHVEQHVYSITRLSSSIGLEHFAPGKLCLGVVDSGLTNLTAGARGVAADNWWASVAIERPSKRLRHEPPNSQNQQDISCEDASNVYDIQLHAQAHSVSVVDGDPNPGTQSSVQDAIPDLVKHYLQELYLSKASHAYFAKAPMARARAAFKQASPNGDTSSELVSALKDMIMPPQVLDKKYRTRVPEMVKIMAVTAPEQPAATSRSRPPKPKKLKRLYPNKDGMYSLEEEFLKGWWAAEEAHHTTAIASASEIHHAVQQLRRRETLFQIILILEALALEKYAQRTEGAMQGHTDVTMAENPLEGTAKRRPHRKPQDLETVLDVLVDRLCIQQSIEVEPQQIESKEKELFTELPEMANDTKERPDELTDFCLAVAIPFYGPRLPKIVDTLSVRFGVRASESPEKARSTKSRHAPKPGAEIKRRPRDRTRNPLQRVMSDGRKEKVSKQPPSLLRSATDSRLSQGLERPRSSTPQTQAHRSLSRAGSISQASQPIQREVDLSAMTRKLHTSKANHKATIDQELKSAIATLRKPNRGIAIKDYIDAAEERKASAKMRSATARGPNVPGLSRVKSDSGVQVDATPRKGLKHSFNPTSPEPTLLQESPSSSRIADTDPVVPSSSLKQLSGSRQPGSQLRASRVSQAQVEQTPTRASYGRRDMSPISTNAFEGSDDDLDGFPPSPVRRAQTIDAHFKTPLKKMAPLSKIVAGQRPAFPGLTGTTSQCESPDLPGPHPGGEVAFGPVDSPQLPEKHTASEPIPDNRTGEKSIYDVLGWNDDEDDLI